MNLAGLLLRLSGYPDSSKCWEWNGSRHPSGYGKLLFEGAYEYVHRVTYRVFLGPIPEGMELDHLCRVRWCANPWHTEAVDHKVNMNRGNSPSALIRRTGMCAKGRHPLGAPGHGCRDCSRESRSAQRKAPACPVYNGGRGMGSLALRAMLEKKA